MKCNDVMTFLSQINAKSIAVSVSEEDLNFLINSGYVECLSKDEYEKLLASVADMPKVDNEIEELREKENVDKETITHDQKKIHSIHFWFEGRDKKGADRERVQTEEQIVSKEEEAIHEKDSELQSLIQKKSMLDRQACYGERYLSLTGSGVIILHDLTTRNYRVGDMDFNAFMQETKAIEVELQSIVGRASCYYSEIKDAIANMKTSPLADKIRRWLADTDEEDEDNYRIKSKGVESSQLWAVSIGLAKLEGDTDKIKESFIKMVNMLQKFNSNLDSKLMAAETLVASGHVMYPQLLEPLTNIERQIRQSANVPEELSLGIATTIYCGINPNGLTRFNDGFFCHITKSYMAAALLSSSQETQDNLCQKFESFKSIFDAWGYSPSEDTVLAAAYLTLSNLSEKDAQDKMNIIVDALKTGFEFPLVPSAILTTMPLNAIELLDLVEKAATILQSQVLTTGLSHSELASLAIRLIYGQG
jgi:hypothetical protein